MACFSFGERDHDIAVIKVPDNQPVGSSGLAHTALEIDGGEEQRRELAARLRSFGARVEFATDHVLTKSVYVLDPDGNRLEIFSQEMTPADEAVPARRACRRGCHETAGPGERVALSAGPGLAPRAAACARRGRRFAPTPAAASGGGDGRGRQAEGRVSRHGGVRPHRHHRGPQRRGPGHPAPVALRYAMPISRRLPSRKVTVSV